MKRHDHFNEALERALAALYLDLLPLERYMATILGNNL